jgi:predicted nucleic acid-binding protein
VIIISDTGPLISLAGIDKLNLLEELYGDIYIPQAVWDEIQPLIELFDIPDVKRYEKKIKKLTTKNIYVDLADYGESEAMVLYKELNANYLLVDDSEVRVLAENQSINCMGALAVLIDAKNAGLIDALRPLFKMLLKNNRYYATPLLNRILQENAEKKLG